MAGEKRNLAIQIALKRIEMLSAAHRDIGLILEQELSIWRRFLGARRVLNLELGFRPHILEPYQVTRLIHQVARLFNVEGTSTYRVVIRPQDARETTFALLKGLGFTHCQFVVEHIEEAAIMELSVPINQARHFQFEKIGIQLALPSCIAEIATYIKDLHRYLKPDYVLLGRESRKLTCVDIASETVLHQADLGSTDCDLLGIGVGATSILNEWQLIAYAEPELYLDAIGQHHMPIKIPNASGEPAKPH